jgi:isopenicillin-N epimerase
MNYKSLFQLNPEVTFLNFGSFGATPLSLTADYRKWQDMLESEPVQFMTVQGPKYLEESRKALGKYIGCHHDDLVYVMNPSYAINIIARSLKLNPGEEILTTDLEYGAMDKTWNYYSKQNGYVYRRQNISLPLTSKEAFLHEFWKGYNEKTRVVFISQITSSTGLIFPVKEICERAKELGLITIVDGAHVPGHIDLDLSELKADIYTGACHKWMMTPKGCSFLYVKREMQSLFDPLLISWGYQSAMPSHSQFLDYHQQQGTRDFSAFLTVPASIDFIKKHQWKELAKSCRKLAQSNIERFCELLDTVPLAPIGDEFFGQMCSFQIKTNDPQKLKAMLYDQYRIEIPVMLQGDKVFIRYSINAFNDQNDLDLLYRVLKEIIALNML